jgi:hypothetical protein
VGWQDFVLMNPKGQLNMLPPSVPLDLAMSVLGPTGITAYFGLIDVGRPVAGETVVVSGGPARRVRSSGRSRKSRVAATSASRAANS